MAKQKTISLKAVVAEIDKVEKELKTARKKATLAADKKKLDVGIRSVESLRKACLMKCRNTFAVVPPDPDGE